MRSELCECPVTGGRYLSGGRAHEEDLCRLLPQLYPSLTALTAAEDVYPLAPYAAIFIRQLQCFRAMGPYKMNLQSLREVTVITASMPCGVVDKRPIKGWLNSA